MDFDILCCFRSVFWHSLVFSCLAAQRQLDIYFKSCSSKVNLNLNWFILKEHNLIKRSHRAVLSVQSCLIQFRGHQRGVTWSLVTPGGVDNTLHKRQVVSGVTCALSRGVMLWRNLCTARFSLPKLARQNFEVQLEIRYHLYELSLLRKTFCCIFFFIGAEKD